MRTLAFNWLLTLVPSLPFVFLFIASRRVLFAKQFEMETLLKRGETLTKYLSVYGGSQPFGDSPGTVASKEAQIRNVVQRMFQLRYSIKEYVPAFAFTVVVTAILMALALLLAGAPLGFSLPVPLAGNKDLA